MKNNIKPLSFDPSNRYRTPSCRIVGSRDGSRSKYGVKVESKARAITKIIHKAPSKRDQHRAEVASRRER